MGSAPLGGRVWVPVEQQTGSPKGRAEHETAGLKVVNSLDVTPHLALNVSHVSLSVTIIDQQMALERLCKAPFYLELAESLQEASLSCYIPQDDLRPKRGPNE